MRRKNRLVGDDKNMSLIEVLLSIYIYISNSMVLSFLVRFEKGAYTHTHLKGDYFFLSKMHGPSVRPSSQIKREISVVLLLLLFTSLRYTSGPPFFTFPETTSIFTSLRDERSSFAPFPYGSCYEASHTSRSQFGPSHGGSPSRATPCSASRGPSSH